jgi:hypothetical protein
VSDCQAGKAGVEGGLAHTVVDGGNARAAGQFSDGCPELLWVVGVVEHIYRAGLPRQLRLVRSRGGGDDAGAEAGCPLGQDQADAACPGVHQHGVAVLDGIYGLDEQVRCHAFQNRRRGYVCADSIWHRSDDIGWGNAVFGVGADGVGGRNAVAHPQCRHPVAYRCDRAAHLCAKDKWKFPRIQPRPEIGVDEVHTDRFGFDQHFTPTRGGPRLVDVLQDFGSTGCDDFDGVHSDDSNLMHSTLSMKRGTTADA